MSLIADPRIETIAKAIFMGIAHGGSEAEWADDPNDSRSAHNWARCVAEDIVRALDRHQR